jgi:RNA polymerase sigma-70 factor, ECF subfamily
MIRSRTTRSDVMDEPAKSRDGFRLSEESFVGLVVRHERRVRAFIKTLLPLDVDVDDLVQEVSMVAWQKFPAFRYWGNSPDEQFVRWLCTIAKFQVLNERKKRLSKKMVVPFDDALIEELSALQLQQAAYFDDRQQALAECINKLSGREREIIRLRYGLGEPIAAIATYLGREPVTAYQVVARIRTQLLGCVERTLRREGY